MRLRDSDHAYGSSITDVFVTREVAVSPAPLADLITKTVIDSDGINVMTDTAVIAADAGRRLIEAWTADGWPAVGTLRSHRQLRMGGTPRYRRNAGLPIDGPWTFRMKYYLSATAPPGGPLVPSTTVVLGAFGDIVDYGNSEYYLSWYPAGRRGWSTDLAPPAGRYARRPPMRTTLPGNHGEPRKRVSRRGEVGAPGR